MGSAVRHWMRWDDRCGWGVSVGILLATGMLLACKPRAGGTATPAPGAATNGDGAPTSGDVDAVADGPSSEEPQCAPQGTPWDGNPKGCTYEHGGCCYPDPGSLCAAAGCTDDNCTILESHPAGASC